MAGKNLKQLLEEAREVMRSHEPMDCYLRLEESLAHDHYWEAKSVELDTKNGLENSRQIILNSGNISEHK